MTFEDSRQKRIEWLLDQVKQLERDKRSEFLDDHCDPEEASVRRVVEELAEGIKENPESPATNAQTDNLRRSNDRIDSRSKKQSDRNLLFAVVALQMDFIDRESMVRAMHEWTFTKDETVGSILVRNGDLAESDHQLLEGLVDRHVEKHHGDPEHSLVALGPLGSVRDDLRQIDSSELHESITYLSRVNLEASSGESEPDSLDDFSRVGESKVGGEHSTIQSRYQTVRVHAEGGIGKVSIAIDRELNREVALKEIKDAFVDDEASRARFVLEAEITGGLEHPGIVPVYGLGHHQDGQPYYAMRFIRGDSLKDAISRFHDAKDQMSRSAKMLAFRKLLGRFVDVCNAIEYAHSRGVLHRDLKPGNIMLGKYGETLVVDWGLAKPIGRDDFYKELDESTLQPSSGGSNSATQMGSAVGTPHFMSPEQAAGRLDELGPSTDVYGLGATFYYLLANRAPFKDPNLEIVLAQVQLGEFKSPRHLDEEIPRPLEAICLKAMAFDPKDRYRSPKSLAADVERWMADEPIEVFRDPPLARVFRWVRQHQTWAVSGATVLLVLLASLVSVVGIVSSKNRRLSEANGRERQAKIALEANLREANAMRYAFQARQLITDFPIESLRTSIGAIRETQLVDGVVVPIAHQSLIDSMEGFGGYSFGMVDDEIERISFTANGRRMVAIGQKGAVEVWDMQLDDPLASSMQLLTASEDSRVRIELEHRRWLLVNYYSGQIEIWDLEDQGVPEPVVVAHEFLEIGDELGVKLSKDGSALIAFASNGKLMAWSMTSNPAEAVSLDTSSVDVAIVDAHFTNDGERIVTENQDGSISVWTCDSSAGVERLANLELSDSSLSIVAPGSLQSRLVTVDSNNRLHAWEFDAFTEGEPRSTVLTVGAESDEAIEVHSFVASDNGFWLAAVIDDQEVWRWNLNTDKPWEVADFLWRAETPVIRLFTDREDRYLVACAADHSTLFHLLEPASQEPTSFVLRGPINADRNRCAISENGRWVLTGSLQAPLLLWRIEDNYITDVAAELRGHNESAWSIEMDSKGQWLVTTGLSRDARLWKLDASQRPKTMFRLDCGVPLKASNTVIDAQSDKMVVWLEGETSAYSLALSKPDPSYEFEITRYEAPLSGSDLTTDGNHFVAALADGLIAISHLASPGEEPSTFDSGLSGAINCVATSDDGHWLAAASKSGRVNIYDLRQAGEASIATTIEIDTASRRGLASASKLSFSPDGKWFVIVAGRTLDIYNLRADKPSRVWRRYTGKRIAFGSEGRYFLVVEEAGQIVKVDLFEEQVREYSIDEDQLLLNAAPIAFDRSGQLLAVGGVDGSVRVWRLGSEKQARLVNDYLNERDAITSIAISSTNKWLIAGSTAGRVKMWNRLASDNTGVTLLACDRPISTVGFADGDKWAYAASDDGSVRLWSLKFDRLIEVVRSLLGTNTVETFPADAMSFGSTP